jgi:uracil-DNA glycosylase family 4
MGHGYVPGSGPLTNLLFLGEAPGYEEAIMGRPFVGAAGGMHTRILSRNGVSRDAYRHENVLRCVPPGFEIKQGWAQAAADHCRQHRESSEREARVVVALGSTAIREALGLWNFSVDDVKVNNFHGTVHDRPDGSKVVCTFHPSYLQRGAINLFGVVSFDLQVALEVLRGEYKPDPIETVIDPPVEWFEGYVEAFEAEQRDNPQIILATDIETPDKEKGKAEDELDENDKSFQIDRVNFAFHRDQGITVPHTAEYLPLIRRLITAAKRHAMWNGDYDVRRLLAFGHRIPGVVLDAMWLAHHLNSNIPLGMGFWAPFYSRHGAWKHKFSTEPGYYAACDGPQTLRILLGVMQDLKEAGQWDTAYRHTVTYMQDVLKPAQHLGIHVDRPKLETFEAELTLEVRHRLRTLQEIVPEALRQLTPKEGLTKPPVGDHGKARLMNTRTGAPLADADDKDPLKIELYKQARVVDRTVPRTLWCCRSCGAEGVQERHRCTDKSLSPSLEKREVFVKRWYWQEPFNPDSPPQVLAYMKHKRHKPGRNKKTKKDSTDRDTLTRLRASTKDPFYAILLDLRALGKVRGTYAIGIRKRLDGESRFHPTFTLRPSTLRNSAVAPNIQNVVGDKDENNLAAGFRAVITATDEIPEWAKGMTPEELGEYV